MDERSEPSYGLTIWGFLATVAEAWPILLGIPILLGGLAYFLPSEPVWYQSSAVLPVPYEELRGLALDRAVAAALSEQASPMSAREIMSKLSMSPVAGQAHKSVLIMQHSEADNGDDMLERIARGTVAIAASTYVQEAKDELDLDLANTRNRIATLDLLHSKMLSAISEADPVSRDMEGMAAAATTLLDVTESLGTARVMERKLLEDLALIDVRLAEPIAVEMAPRSANNPLRLALVVAAGAETLLLIFFVLRENFGSLRLNDSDNRNIARIRRAFGLRDRVS